MLGSDGSEEWVDVLVTCDPVEAEMVKDLLESGGIPVVLRSSKVSPFPVNIGKIGEIRILVPQADKALAGKVIKGEEGLRVLSAKIRSF